MCAKKKVEATPTPDLPFPETYKELVDQTPLLKGTTAKAIPSDTGLFIAIVNGESIKKMDFPQRREAVAAITRWARHKFEGQYVAGVVMYDQSMADTAQMAKELGGTLVSVLTHRRWPDRWSKDVIGGTAS